MEYLPDLDFRNHAIVERVVEDVLWWVTEYDLDGFRLDAAKHMDHVILRRLRYELDRRFAHGDAPHFYLVGETYTGEDGHGLIMNYVAEWELDGQFDFPLLYPIRSVFADGGSFRTLAARVQLGRDLYGDAIPWMSPFFGNHDIPRFASRISHPSAGAWDGFADPMKGELGDTQWNIINRTSHAAVFTLLQEGIPLLYYGDELALAGGPDPDNRRTMDFEPFLSDAQREMLGRMRQIGQARRAHPALRRGVYRELWVDDSLYVFARVLAPGQAAIVALNRGGRRDQALPIPADLGLDGRTLTDLLGTDRSLRVEGGEAQIGLNDWEYVVWGTP
jgi:glycosidase